MAKRKAGLHKKISSIFDGVPVPEEDTEQPTGASLGRYADHVALEKPATDLASQPVPESARPVSDTLSELAEPDLEETLGVPAPEKPTGFPTRAGQIEPKADLERKAEIGTTVTEWASSHTFQQIKDKLFALREGVGSGRQKAMVILVPALLIVLLIVLGRSLTGSSNRAAPPLGIEPTNAQPSVASTNIEWEMPELYPTTLRDPMMQVVSMTVPPQQQKTNRKLEVRGIVYSQDNPTAVLGAGIVHEGDVVSGAIVIKINKNSVEFEKDGKRWTEKVQN
jgi:hypothetical protein